jgi:hypothetical protein
MKLTRPALEEPAKGEPDECFRGIGDPGSVNPSVSGLTAVVTTGAGHRGSKDKLIMALP